jgi:hypothetical protein
LKRKLSTFEDQHAERVTRRRVSDNHTLHTLTEQVISLNASLSEANETLLRVERERDDAVEASRKANTDCVAMRIAKNLTETELLKQKEAELTLKQTVLSAFNNLCDMG